VKTVVRQVMMIAGEASGDLHGGGVVRELRRLRPGVQVFGIGGDRMRAEGMELVRHISAMAFMGFAEVVRNLPFIRRVEAEMEGLLRDRRPDVVVLIDYPGFNLRFARTAKRHGVPVLYYISPQVWAWHRSRVGTIKGLVSAMKVVFPFEVEIYRAAGVDVEFVGHPLVESLGDNGIRAEVLARLGLDPAGRVLGLFPGSRRQEIERVLPAAGEAALALHRKLGVQVALGLAPNLDEAFVRSRLPAALPVRIVAGDTHALMQWSDAAVVTSGTATLETGWYGTPMMVVYRTSPLTYAIGRALVDVPAIGLVNIVAGRKVVQEFIQGALTPAALQAEAERILTDTEYAAGMRRDLGVIRERLGAPGASVRVAQGIVRLAEAGTVPAAA
jgi:lipid-A-disaccharide synthase